MRKKSMDAFKNELTNKWDDIDESLWVGVLRSLRMVAKEENTELNKRTVVI